MNKDHSIAAAIIIAGGGITLSIATLAEATDGFYGDEGFGVGVGMLVVGGLLLINSVFGGDDKE